MILERFIFFKNSIMYEINQPTNDEKMWAMLCHLAGLLHFIPFGQIVGPLVIWVIKKEESSFVDDQGKQALNFQISMLIYILLCIPFVFIVIGIFALIALGIINLILVIIAAVNANNGVLYRYPLAMPLIR